mmetsp:Transcript_23424/g.59265  ORF Transcript_23424/g.59265 Transcript_23424/m.59265 type:complete len:1134 (-) Transcript_23424:101-3502(-)
MRKMLQMPEVVKELANDYGSWTIDRTPSVQNCIDLFKLEQRFSDCFASTEVAPPNQETEICYYSFRKCRKALGQAIESRGLVHNGQASEVVDRDALWKWCLEALCIWVSASTQADVERIISPRAVLLSERLDMETLEVFRRTVVSFYTSMPGEEEEGEEEINPLYIGQTLASECLCGKMLWSLATARYIDETKRYDSYLEAFARAAIPELLAACQGEEGVIRLGPVKKLFASHPDFTARFSPSKDFTIKRQSLYCSSLRLSRSISTADISHNPIMNNLENDLLFHFFLLNRGVSRADQFLDRIDEGKVDVSELADRWVSLDWERERLEWMCPHSPRKEGETDTQIPPTPAEHRLGQSSATTKQKTNVKWSILSVLCYRLNEGILCQNIEERKALMLRIAGIIVRDRIAVATGETSREKMLPMTRRSWKFLKEALSTSVDGLEQMIKAISENDMSRVAKLFHVSSLLSEEQRVCLVSQLSGNAVRYLVRLVTSEQNIVNIERTIHEVISRSLTDPILATSGARLIFTLMQHYSQLSPSSRNLVHRVLRDPKDWQLSRPQGTPLIAPLRQIVFDEEHELTAVHPGGIGAYIGTSYFDAALMSCRMHGINSFYKEDFGVFHSLECLHTLTAVMPNAAVNLREVLWVAHVRDFEEFLFENLHSLTIRAHGPEVERLLSIFSQFEQCSTRKQHVLVKLLRKASVLVESRRSPPREGALGNLVYHETVVDALPNVKVFPPAVHKNYAGASLIDRAIWSCQIAGKNGKKGIQTLIPAFPHCTIHPCMFEYALSAVKGRLWKSNSFRVTLDKSMLHVSRKLTNTLLHSTWFGELSASAQKQVVDEMRDTSELEYQGVHSCLLSGTIGTIIVNSDGYLNRALPCGIADYIGQSCLDMAIASCLEQPDQGRVAAGLKVLQRALPDAVVNFKTIHSVLLHCKDEGVKVSFAEELVKSSLETKAAAGELMQILSSAFAHLSINTQLLVVKDLASTKKIIFWKSKRSQASHRRFTGAMGSVIFTSCDRDDGEMMVPTTAKPAGVSDYIGQSCLDMAIASCFDEVDPAKREVCLGLLLPSLPHCIIHRDTLSKVWGECNRRELIVQGIKDAPAAQRHCYVESIRGASAFSKEAKDLLESYEQAARLI